MLISSRVHSFRFFVMKLSGVPLHVLLNILQQPTSFTTLYRSASLRILISRAPLDVTQGRPYAERRRLVRGAFSV